MRGELGRKRERLTGAKADAALWGIALPQGWDEDDDADDGVWAENEGAILAFLEICTQFRFVSHFDGSLQRTGLDYLAAEVGLRQAGVEVTPELWQSIKVIESGVITSYLAEGEV